MEQLQKLSNLHLAIEENSMELMQIEKRLTVEMVLKSENAVFKEIGESEELENMKTIDILTQRFLIAHFPDTNHVEVSRQFTMDIMEIKSDWKLQDIILMFKYVRQNQHIKELKVLGNKINALKLMEFANVYDDFRANERAKVYRDQKIEQIPSNVMDGLLRIAQQIKNKPKRDTMALILAQKKEYRESIAKAEILKNKVLNGEITKEEFLKEITNK